MTIDLAEYFIQNGYQQTRNSDKRDAYEKVFFHPMLRMVCNIGITIHHQAYFSEIGFAIPTMEVKILYNGTTAQIFYGFAPSNFDSAESLFELIMPTENFIRKYYN